jgi:ComF family protein
VCRDNLATLRLRNDACPRCMSRVNEQGVCVYCRSGAMKGLKAGYAAYRYMGEARQLIWLLKFHWQDEAVLALTESMAEAVPRGEYDALVPVPLHPRRLRRRGKNQAETLCGLLSPRLGLPVLQGLKRIRNTHSQVSLSAALRKQNVKGAFQAIESVEGLRLLLVDDVRTTGATARECARELTRAGAGTVGIMTAALVEKAE